MLQKYTPSGTFNIKFLIGVPVVLLGAAALGVVYQFLIHYIPFIKLDILIVILMCLATIFLVQKLTRLAHCRSRLMGAGIGLAAGVVAVAVSHFVQYWMDRPGLIATVPADKRAVVDAHFGILQYLQYRAESGWSFGHVGSTPSGSGDITGVGVYLCWGIEALTIVLAAGVGGMRAASAPYCEQCGAWADRDMLKVEVPEPAADLVASVKSARTLDQLFPPASATSQRVQGLGSFMRYSVKSCPTCKMTHTLNVEHEQLIVNGKKAQKKVSSLHKGVVLTSEEVGRLAQLKGVPLG